MNPPRKKKKGSMRPGRPRIFNEDKVLDAAMRVFWENGYETTSMANLTDCMGMSAPSLYSAFGSKQKLFECVVERYKVLHGSFMTDIFREEKNARKLIARLLREAASRYTDPRFPRGCLIIKAGTNVAPANSEVQRFLREIRQTNINTIEECIRGGIESGEFPINTVPRSIAVFIAAVIQGMSQQACDGATTQELLGLVDLALQALPK
jgi:AcrR family transcriptional regulator